VKRIGAHRKGQGLVELAFILPILVVLFCAVCHFGILFYLQIGLEQGVREGALFGAYHPRDNNVIRNMVLLSLPSLVDPQELSLDIKADSRSVGDPMTIKIQYNIQLLKALPFGAILPVPTEIRAIITVPIVDAGL
jgi:hypothetical protein